MYGMYVTVGRRPAMARLPAPLTWTNAVGRPSRVPLSTAISCRGLMSLSQPSCLGKGRSIDSVYRLCALEHVSASLGGDMKHL